MLSAPKPALNTSMPPLPVRVSSPAPDDYSGSSVSSAGDVNGDGLDDLIVGAKYADPSGNESGKSYVIFGKTDTDAIRQSLKCL
jgi:hypothetical protein